MIVFRASTRCAAAVSDDAVTVGSVGIPVFFTFSAEWDGVQKIVIFKSGDVAVDVALTGSSCPVPPECLAVADEWLTIGVYGANSAGTVVIPTVWAEAAPIRPGAEPSGVDPAEPTPSWVAQVQEMASEALAHMENMTAEAQTLPAGDPATASWDPETDVLTLGIPKGETGARGPAGADGGPGPRGEDGAPGTPGADGFSPTVSIVDIPGGHRITITDAEGPHSFDVMDGQGGGGSGGVFWAEYGVTTNAEIEAAQAADQIVMCEYNSDYYRMVYLEAGYALFNTMSGANELVLECDTDAWSNSSMSFGSYSKPSGGIPKSDLASGVQTSLGLADSAYQKPSGGIPDTDLSSGVQSSLDKADDALPKTGGTMSGAIAMGSNKITGLDAGVADGDAVNVSQMASAISQSAAYYRGSFATRAALLAVAWQTSDPQAANYVTNNDYAIVLDDETQNDECWRYLYVLGTGWTAQYRINETPLTQAQLDALNSGATSTNIGQIATNTTAIAGKLAANQGAGNAGKFMIVGSDGIVTPVAMSVWQGGSY